MPMFKSLIISKLSRVYKANVPVYFSFVLGQYREENTSANVVYVAAKGAI